MAYVKPQSPIKKGEDFVYPLTTHDQIILPDGSRWDGGTVAHVSYTATFASGGWTTTAPYTQTTAAAAALATDSPVADLDTSSLTTSNYSTMMDEWAKIGRIIANDGSVTAYCYESVPTTNLTVRFSVTR